VISRREFTQSLGGAVALAVLRPRLLWAADPARVSATAGAVYRSAYVLDCNTLSSIGQVFSGDGLEQMVKALRESGVSAVKSTLGGANGSFEQTLTDIAAAERLLESRPDLFLKVRAAADFASAQRQRKLGVIYSFEAASPLADKVERIELFRNFGVRVMQLTYNRTTPFGVGCLDGEEGGLTDLGQSAVERMNALGVALDLSHSNTQTTAEGIKASARPPIFSHAGCRAVYRHPRNKEDRELKALADKGGVVGIYMLPFLTESPQQPTLDDYLEHMAHALTVCGEDHVGIGTDVPFETIGEGALAEIRKEVEERKAAGISAPGEDRPPYIPALNTPRKLELVTDALLKRGYPARVVEKVLGANFRRVFGEIWRA
jgi:membrane dipeptidase